MPSDTKIAGRKLALSLVNKINAVEKKIPPAPPEKLGNGGTANIALIETPQLVEVLRALQDNHIDIKPIVAAIESSVAKPLNLNPLIEAVNALDLQLDIDVSAIAKEVEALSDVTRADSTRVVNKLGELVAATDKNTDALLELVKVAGASKVMVYDSFGRIIEVKIKV